MPEYTLKQLEKYNYPRVTQILLWGDTIENMKNINPKGTVKTWVNLDKYKIVFDDGMKMSNWKE